MEENVKRIELKHIAPYLPYGLKVEHTYFGKHEPEKSIDTISAISSEWISFINSCDYYFDDSEPECDIKPILRNLSDLTKEIEVNGERFVPALKLVEFLIEKGLYEDIAPTVDFKYKIITKPFGKILKVSKLDDWVIMLSLDDPFRSKYLIVEKLFEWQFDVFGLIENGLAIDMNTLQS